MGAPVVAATLQPMPAAEGELKTKLESRVTRDGRTLWYQLRVIQQPERARACGSGPKSSADRRPVDPPPVVELRIFEGRTFEEARNKDITFLYNANFFLYATLEHARVMAHGRVQTPAANTPPVLTGMPVSGMAYLDRPEEAGYFLFPDLSVRHEGRYRLTFNLYEETKEDKDRDSKAEIKPTLPGGMSDAQGGSFDFRMEVQSQDFVVYSAKKFPGLTESTNLSRLVAEQGCRVRIRRDVRMRRRDGKGSNGDYENNAEDEYARRRRTETPDNTRDQHRARSMSGSVERTPYSADSSGRRPSIADYAQFPQTPSSGHLGFMGGSSTSQYPPQPQALPQPGSVPPSPSYPPSQSSAYPAQPSYPPPPPYPSERPPSQPYGAPSPAPHRGSIQYEPPRKGSLSLPPLQSLPSPSYSNGPAPVSASLPSVQVLTSQPQPTLMPNMISPRQPLAPRVSSITHPSQLPPPQPFAGQKRGRDNFSREDYQDLRRQNGARDDYKVTEVTEESLLEYRRADGSVVAKTDRGF